MVRPLHFAVNQQTAADNVFQVETSAGIPAHTLARDAYDEVTNVADALRSAGVEVILFDDETPTAPDSVFPNNWFSTHHGGHIAIYPMALTNRRGERRHDVIDVLKARFRVQDVIDYSGLEHDGLYLEGTGAMVLDHIERVAYVATSNRANPIVLERFCTNFGYEPMAFAAADDHGTAIYHTNVLMCVATSFALIGLDAIVSPARRDEIVDRLESSGRDVIDLSHAQLLDFSGNAFELTGSCGSMLAMSGRARRSLTERQVARIERTAQIVSIDLPTIELAGGSMRCMLAGVHLPERRLAATARRAPDADIAHPAALCRTPAIPIVGG